MHHLSRQSYLKIEALIDAHVNATVLKTAPPPSDLYLACTQVKPLQFFDNNGEKLLVSQDDLSTYLTSYEKIKENTTVLLENVELSYQLGKNLEVKSVEVASKNISINWGTPSRTKLKDFEIRLYVDSKDIKIMPSTKRLLRRQEKQELVKKHYKPSSSKTDVLNFSHHNPADSSAFAEKGSIQDEIGPLDTQSKQLLGHLLGFVNKEDLLRVCVKKTLAESSSKKAVRLMVVPTDTEEDSDSMQVNKKTYQRETISELLQEYRAREERMNEQR